MAIPSADSSNARDLPRGESAPVIRDGTVQTYRLSLHSYRMKPVDGPWTDLGIWFNTETDQTTATLELLSVRMIPAEAVAATLPRVFGQPDSWLASPNVNTRCGIV